MFSLSTMCLKFFFAHESMKRPASKVAEPAQIQPKSQFLFHKNLPPRDFSLMTLVSFEIFGALYMCISDSNINLDEKIYSYNILTNQCMGQISLFQKLPRELGMDFTTTISSLPIFIGGIRHIINPSEKVRKSSRPHKWMET